MGTVERPLPDDSAGDLGDIGGGGSLPYPIRSVIEQLWRPALAGGAHRAVLDPKSSIEWVNLECYRVIPSPTRARLLIPGATTELGIKALSNYRGLRGRTARSQRGVLAAAIAVGLPVATHRLVLQRRSSWRDSHDDAAPSLPLAHLASALGVPALHASIGVRTGANRKATLQLVDDRGAPAGFAKFGWNAASARLVRTEAEALRRVGGELGPLRAPRLLAEGTWCGLPYLVSAPLPAHSQRLHSDAAPPNPGELAALCPVSRRSSLVGTAHLAGLRDRVSAARGSTGTSELDDRATGLVRELARRSESLPIAARWHGDLAPWNAARDREGVLWAWDWEYSEPDVLAGIDSVHWAISVRRERGERVDGAALLGALTDATPHLVAFGLDPSGRAIAGALYALTVAERALTLAAAADEKWHRLWIQPPQVANLLDAAAALLRRLPPAA